MWQRFSPTSRRVLLQAQHEAGQWRQNEVDTEHLLLALLREKECAGVQMLQQLGVTGQKVQAELRAEEHGEEDKNRLASHFEKMTARIRADVDSSVIERVEKELHRKMREQSDKPELLLSEQLKRVLKIAADEANVHGAVISTTHLLIGLLREPNNRAKALLQALDLDENQVRGLAIERFKPDEKE